MRKQALDGARENNAILIVIHKEDRRAMDAVGAGDYSSLPPQFREVLELLDGMVGEGLFTREPHVGEGILYTITQKGREAR